MDVTIKNESAGAFHLPTKYNDDGEAFGQGVMLAAGTSLSVPAWYMDALHEEKGWRKRLGSGNVVSRRVKADPTELHLRRIAAASGDRVAVLERQLSEMGQELSTIRSKAEARFQAAQAEAKASREVLIESHRREIEKLTAAAAAKQGESPGEHRSGLSLEPLAHVEALKTRAEAVELAAQWGVSFADLGEEPLLRDMRAKLALHVTGG